jgi:hypothetical protein
MKNILVLIFILSSIFSFAQNSQENKSNTKLTGRGVQFTPTIDNNCNSVGKVVLEITVDKSGKTISAVNSKDSTADNCLIELAIKYALKTKWKPSETAPEKQVGKIIYNFSF